MDHTAIPSFEQDRERGCLDFQPQCLELAEAWSGLGSQLKGIAANEEHVLSKYLLVEVHLFMTWFFSNFF